jgi:uncharacterized protein (DUF1778 family)
VAAPKEPITINMNVKIEHEIHIKVDKDVESLLKRAAICSEVMMRKQFAVALVVLSLLSSNVVGIDPE